MTFTMQAQVDSCSIPQIVTAPGPVVVTVEPWEPITLPKDLLEAVDEVRCGGSGGELLRSWPSHPDNIASIERQCKEAGVKYTFAGWGNFEPYDPVRHRHLDVVHTVSRCGATGVTRTSGDRVSKEQWMVRADGYGEQPK
jgi:hypothetical protein